MNSVGILAADQKWSGMLSEHMEGIDWQVSGLVNPMESGAHETDRLIELSDLVWIPQKMDGGMAEATRVIRRSRHLSLGFPVSDFMDEAHCLIKLAHEARIQVQVGHYERHRPVFRSCLPLVDHPQHIRITRHLAASPGTGGRREILMAIFSDLDLAVGLIRSTVRKVRSQAAYIGDEDPYQVDSRIEFHNGSIISLLLKTKEPLPVREISAIQHNGILEINLLDDRSRFIQSYQDQGTWSWKQKIIWPVDSAPSTDQESGLDRIATRQCINFLHALQKGRESLSGLEDSYRALEITRQIESAINGF